VEGDIAHITAERNYVVSDIQAKLMAAELDGMPTNGATDEADTTCLLDYANTLKAYAQSGGTTATPTDCNIGVVGAQLPEVPYPSLLALAGGLVLAGGVFLFGRRRRSALG
jgi:LPXTG-motif cell wall-anchored protein